MQVVFSEFFSNTSYGMIGGHPVLYNIYVVLCNKCDLFKNSLCVREELASGFLWCQKQGRFSRG